MSEELKPCPFCGRPAEIYEDPRITFGGTWWIRCQYCWYHFGGDAEKQHVINKFNTRKEPKLKEKITQHWLCVAYDRLTAGESEKDIMSDYGYVKEPQP